MGYFDHVVRYDVTATCQSPLRTGGVNHAVDEVLHLEDGTCLLQASSLAGVLRQYVARQFPGQENLLFGSANREKLGSRSPLEVTDGIFCQEAVVATRPRVRLDERMGVVQNYFRMTGVETGASFTFSLFLRTERRKPEWESILESALGALNAGEITLGAQQANGYGKVTLQVRRRRFDLKQAGDRTSWLEDCPAEELMELPADTSCVCFVVTGRVNSVLIRSGKRENQGKKKVALAMTDRQGAFLPGSSVKGCLRSRAALIANWLGCTKTLDRLFGREALGGTDTGQAGCLRVQECHLERPASRVITRTRISRFTGGVMEEKLFSERPVSDTITLRVDLRTEDPACCALAFYALRDLALGLYNLGSEGSVGRGYLKDGALTVTAGKETCRILCREGGQTVQGEVGFVARWLEALEQEGEVSCVESV